jgi:hypothetical protein
LNTVISYDVVYPDSNERENGTFELDIASLTRTQGSGIAVVELNVYDYIKTFVGLEGTMVFNQGLSLYNLVYTRHLKNRAFPTGILSTQGYYFNNPVALIEDWNEISEITIPMPDPTLLDFDLYLQTSFGELRANALTLNLESGQTIITAAK